MRILMSNNTHGGNRLLSHHSTESPKQSDEPKLLGILDDQGQSVRVRWRMTDGLTLDGHSRIKKNVKWTTGGGCLLHQMQKQSCDIYMTGVEAAKGL